MRDWFYIMNGCMILFHRDPIKSDLNVQEKSEKTIVHEICSFNNVQFPPARPSKLILVCIPNPKRLKGKSQHEVRGLESKEVCEVERKTGLRHEFVDVLFLYPPDFVQCRFVALLDMYWSAN